MKVDQPVKTDLDQRERAESPGKDGSVDVTAFSFSTKLHIRDGDRQTMKAESLECRHLSQRGEIVQVCCRLTLAETLPPCCPH